MNPETGRFPDFSSAAENDGMMKSKGDMPMTVTESIARLREEQGLSAEELARKTETTVREINDWESGKTVPDASQILKLCDVFSVSADELLGREPGEIREELMEEEVEKTSGRHLLVSVLSAAVALTSLGVCYFASRRADQKVSAMQAQITSLSNDVARLEQKTSQITQTVNDAVAEALQKGSSPMASSSLKLSSIDWKTNRADVIMTAVLKNDAGDASQLSAFVRTESGQTFRAENVEYEPETMTCTAVIEAPVENHLEWYLITPEGTARLHGVGDLFTYMQSLTALSASAYAGGFDGNGLITSLLIEAVMPGIDGFEAPEKEEIHVSVEQYINDELWDTFEGVPEERDGFWFRADADTDCEFEEGDVVKFLVKISTEEGMTAETWCQDGY
ncbi:MAG: helix-turn-helix domain-containing protein, partial [Erysipelotrichaceae bacterium]|nr:helix-turn-helix domain-containing protein [Erysipelotrichaceae bacterium]